MCKGRVAFAMPLTIALVLSGCGLHVPDIQENPFYDQGEQLLVKAIVNSIHCEVKNAVLDALGPRSPSR